MDDPGVAANFNSKVDPSVHRTRLQSSTVQVLCFFAKYILLFWLLHRHPTVKTLVVKSFPDSVVVDFNGQVIGDVGKCSTPIFLTLRTSDLTSRSSSFFVLSECFNGARSPHKHLEDTQTVSHDKLGLLSDYKIIQKHSEKIGLSKNEG
ncbi:hypothetical protein PsorP6_002328 [Peronosclerospora sorghi]|uniref:Uncharacterized protein n=1 Tax=Peronosclerospora sorghi TaxID=230839 RepID=A0ACC0WRW7_9STRA|nr:hypothetical protein PsorP6_002328 [Peronosclerospora sorghi]